MKKLLLITSLLAASSAFAQGAAPGPFYLGVEATQAKLKVKVETPPGGYNTNTAFKDSSGAARVFGGYQFTPNFAVEAGYLTGAKLSFRDTDATGTVDVTDFKVKGFDVAAIWKFTEVVPGLFLKAGVSNTKLSGAIKDVDSAGVVTTIGQASISGTGALFGIGYDLKLTNHLDARFGYTHYQRVAGQGDAKLNAYYAGLKYNF